MKKALPYFAYNNECRSHVPILLWPNVKKNISSVHLLRCWTLFAYSGYMATDCLYKFMNNR